MAGSAPKRKLIRRRGPGREAERTETNGLEQPRGRPRAAAKGHASASGWRDCAGDNAAHLTAGSAADAWSRRRGAVAPVAHQHRGGGGGWGRDRLRPPRGGTGMSAAHSLCRWAGRLLVAVSRVGRVADLLRTCQRPPATLQALLISGNARPWFSAMKQKRTDSL